MPKKTTIILSKIKKAKDQVQLWKDSIHMSNIGWRHDLIPEEKQKLKEAQSYLNKLYKQTFYTKKEITMMLDRADIEKE